MYTILDIDTNWSYNIEMYDNTPKYIVIYNKIKSDILSGKYQQNSFLPTEDQLIEMHNASRTTIRKAIALLKEEKLIDVHQGRGSKVIFQGTYTVPFGLQKSHNFMNVSVSNRFLVDEPYKTASQGAVIDIIEADPSVAKSLEIEVGGKVYRFQRLKLVNSAVFAYVVSYIPVLYCQGIEAYNGQITNLYKVLQDAYGIKIEHGNESVTANIAGFLESKVLDIPVGSPILVLKRVTYSNLSPLEVSQTYFNPKLFELVINMSGISHDFD